MTNTDIFVHKSLSNYFNILGSLGYTSNKETDAALILSYIHDLVSSDYSVFITENDYKVILEVVNCLQNHICYVDKDIRFVEFIEASSVVDGAFRVTGSNEFQLDSDNSYRIIIN